jgi:uncharacterized cupredoxin-like copper-binding protein
VASTNKPDQPLTQASDQPAPRRVSRWPVVVTVVGLAVAGVLVYIGGRLAAQPAPTPDLSRPGTLDQPRAVTVIMRDYVFNPTPLYLVPGETVTFSVINGGLLPHEFVLGDAAVQRAWADANGAASPAAPLATAAPVSVPPGTGGIELVLDPGQQATVTYTVPVGDELRLMCHLPGHVERGMVGSVILATP